MSWISRQLTRIQLSPVKKKGYAKKMYSGSDTGSDGSTTSIVISVQTHAVDTPSSCLPYACTYTPSPSSSVDPSSSYPTQEQPVDYFSLPRRYIHRSDESPLSAYEGSSRLYPCKWAGCRALISDDLEDILWHLVEAHQFIPPTERQPASIKTKRTQEKRLRCLWRNCGKVQRGGLYALLSHIKRDHMEGRVVCWMNTSETCWLG
ncbi:hypothetical protein CPC08DRAFT_730571 [Agrocybe pediades]|nr:hypothetical protein CPC08DRAFT_730571 [Agrocybe pediades]